VHVAANDVAALKAAVGPNTAAILYEPVQAEGGVVNMEPATADALREIQAQGVLLIADEIQTGLWRTGTFLGSEALLAGEGLKPDLVTLAKPLGGGLPLGAILLSEKIAAALKAGDHGSTFGGNPVACAAGLAVLGVLSDAGFQKDYQERIALLRNGLEELAARKQAAGIDIGALRGRGFLIGFQYKGKAEGDGVPALQKRLRDAGVLAHRAGADVLRLLPPLTFSRAEIAELLAALDKALI
jgi:acetylornithine/N-succinyldiaminopimelate aminotransferase